MPVARRNDPFVPFGDGEPHVSSISHLISLLEVPRRADERRERHPRIRRTDSDEKRGRGTRPARKSPVSSVRTAGRPFPTSAVPEAPSYEAKDASRHAGHGRTEAQIDSRPAARPGVRNAEKGAPKTCAGPVGKKPSCNSPPPAWELPVRVKSRRAVKIETGLSNEF